MQLFLAVSLKNHTTLHYVARLLNKPMQLRLPKDLKVRIARIAAQNFLSEADVVRLCLAQAIPIMEEQGLKVLPVDQPAPTVFASSRFS